MKVKVRCIALLAMLVVFMLAGGDRMRTSSNLNEVSVNPERTAAQGTSPGGPVGWAPFREKFTATEGEPFLIAVDVDCPSMDPSGDEFELLPPTPSFVSMSPIYLNTLVPRVATILAVNPQPGTAGKYEIKIGAATCSGSIGETLTFKLKVKRSRCE